MTIAGRAEWNSDRDLLRRVRAVRPDTEFLGGGLDPGAVRTIPALRRILPTPPRLIAPDGFSIDYTVQALGGAADGMYLTVPGLPVTRLPSRGQAFARRLAEAFGGQPDAWSIYAAQATEVLLDAISRSDGTRASIRRALFATRIHDGLVGDFAITPTGDTTERSISVYRILGGRVVFREVLRPR
jgi:ABC-type branched-subunit amino acid transport system substrate-binding protein